VRTKMPWVYLLVVALLPASYLAAQPLSYDAMARRIVDALQVSRGERVLLRVDPATMAPLAPAVRSLLEARGAVVDVLPYGPAPDFDAELARTDIYVWLPTLATMPADQTRALERWLDRGRGRELHFHWLDGTRHADGLPAPHTPAYDRVYLDALDIDYRQLTTRMDDAIARLRVGEVRVTTPHGTDIRFRVGDRPFNKQDGDASKARTAAGRLRTDRHVELPAGVLRVAPIEESASGVIVLPAARFGTVLAEDVRLELANGVVVHARARVGNEALHAFLASDPAASRFREFGLGFNPKLVVPPGESALPYYGYGSGVVRMSLGDNTELGGNVRGGVVRWLFFPDATVRVGADVIVRDGKLTSDQPGGTAMNVQRAEVVHTSILAPRERVIAFLSDMNNWKTWAPWVRAVSKSSARDWMLDTEAGPMKVRFVEQNSLGVLDHEVTLASGVTVLNSMRVLANGSGSELVMVVFQSPAASTDEFERDVQAVRDDLARIKKVAEGLTKAAAR
jgi:hypothetical protein